MALRRLSMFAAVVVLLPARAAGGDSGQDAAPLVDRHRLRCHHPGEPKRDLSLATRAALIRRVTYDLTGLPPTPEEVAAFERDAAADAYERLVERLLASPRYGERWGRHWLDVARFGESIGYERNLILDSAWPFRDYV